MIAMQLHSFADHLWQSTLFTIAAGLLTLALQKNRAQTRYWVWLAASVKFLIPFSLLVSMGSHFGRHAASSITPSRLSYVIDQARGPFTTSVAPVIEVPAQGSSLSWIPTALCVFWMIGSAMLIYSWCRRWRTLRVALRAASPLDLGFGIPVVSSPAFAEPGVFGLCRPVLIMPDGITDSLTTPQLKAIVAHELCHVRRYDNLATAIHMGVEALFWFHPVVWWVGARLVDERERACDEDVLLVSSDPQAYAEGILKICELYLASQLPCVSGVTGANLRKRIERIMANRVGLRLTFTRKMALAVTAIAVFAGPIAVGVMNAPALRADTEERLSFEVASVKANTSNDRQHAKLQLLVPGGRFVAADIPLYRIITVAYDLPFQSPRLSGGPDWVHSERFDIEARAPEGAIPDGTSSFIRVERVRLMLRTLLEDRFKLKVRREIREMPAYAILVTRNGPKLERADVDEKDCPDQAPGSFKDIQSFMKGMPCHEFGGGMGQGLHARAVDIRDLALAVSNWTDRPVVDRTNLIGLFKINTDGWAPMLSPPPLPGVEPTAEQRALADSSRPTLFMIFDRLGLKLEPQKAQIEMFTIEHIERPTEN